MNSKENVTPIVEDGQKLGSVVEQDGSYYVVVRLGDKLRPLHSTTETLRAFSSEELAEQALRGATFSTVETGDKL